MDSNSRAREGRYSILCGVVAVYGFALVLYSQTRAFTGDEGFHLLTAQLIRSGMRPYLDFFFPQPPLNAYWNGFWMALLGQTWRVPHLVAALLTSGAVFLVGDYCYRRFPAPEWRLAAAITAALVTGLNGAVASYGPLAQAYGIGLFLTVAAFRVCVLAAERPGWMLAAAAGLLSGASTACSLLTAPVVPVLFLWSFFYNRAGNRWVKLAAFTAGVLPPWLPVLRLAVLGPHQVWFNLVQYHTQYRYLYWPETTEHDIEILTSWIDTGQALIVIFLAVCGILFVKYRSGWDRQERAAFYLCAWLSVGLAAEISTAHPTFSRYFVFTVPFAAIASVAGLYAIGSRVFEPARPQWPVTAVLIVMLLGCAKTLYERRDMYSWSDYETIAKKIAKVTPPGGLLYADDHVYFVMHRKPRAGLEFAYSHKLPLSAAQMAALHIVSQAEVDRQISSGIFATVYICEDDETYNKLGLPKLYRQKETIEDCTLWWDRQR